MEQLLWTFDQIKPFAHHPDAPLRRWALKHLTKLVNEEWYAALKKGSDDKIDELLLQHAGLLEEASDCQAMLEKLRNHKIFGSLLKLWQRFIRPEFEF